MGAITPPRRRSIGTSGASPRPGAPRSWAGRTRSAFTAKKAAERWAGRHRRALAFVHQCEHGADCPRPPRGIPTGYVSPDPYTPSPRPSPSSPVRHPRELAKDPPCFRWRRRGRLDLHNTRQREKRQTRIAQLPDRRDEGRHVITEEPHLLTADRHTAVPKSLSARREEARRRTPHDRLRAWRLRFQAEDHDLRAEPLDQWRQ